MHADDEPGKDRNMNERGDRDARHITARRGFIATTGFGMLGVYLLWAGYGAAPLGLGHGDDAHGEGAHGTDGHGTTPEPAQAGHAGHGAASARMSKEEFRGLVERFVEAHKLPDGSVQVRRTAAPAAKPAQEDHGHHAAPHGEHAAAGAAPAPAAGDAPVDVYLMAYQFGFLPSVVRLEANVPYRLRMMAVDVAHGASIRVGPGSRIVRLRPGALVEQELTFQRPGEYLVYCTVYCGIAHDRMQGRILVAPTGAKS